MLAVLIIFIFILVAGSLMLARHKRHSLGESKAAILPAPSDFKSLFDDENSAQWAEAAEQQKLDAQRRAALIERARQFDLQALEEAHPYLGLYQDVLGEFIQQTVDRQDKFQTLVGHLSQSKKLRANGQLAEQMMEYWKQSPDNKSTAQLLHLCALSDDAALLDRAVELAAAAWQKGLLPNLSASDFLALAQSEYWVLAPEARRSGAGFILKNSLADLRRTLEATRRG